MKTYGELNLRKLRDNTGLDFAHFTYQRGQCSCCYGPVDMPERYWAKGRKPQKIKSLEDAEIETWNRPMDDIQYILFKNASNGNGIVTKNDTICRAPLKKSYCFGQVGAALRVYIEWQFPREKMDSVLSALQDQLDSDYVILVPEDEYECITIVLHSELQPKDLSKVFKPKPV